MLTETNKAVQGQQQSWNLISKLGEGDAGEVYLVESVLDKRPAILKRPRSGAFFTDVLRQASQIKTEGSVLYGLPKTAFKKRDLNITVPALIDQNRSEFKLSEQTFIIIEQANGLDLKLLSQAIRFGIAGIQTLPANPVTTFLVQQWSQFSEFPAQLLVRIMLSVLDLLETIHQTEIQNEQGVHSGVIWNDVKPEHLYWDPVNTILTVIDWGNSQFLETDGVTKDRQRSAEDDYQQFMQEMGEFIAKANPNLYHRLEWPKDPPKGKIYEEVIEPLEKKLTDLYMTDADLLQELRQKEMELYSLEAPEVDQIAQFEAIKQRLAEFGEMPDSFGVNNFLGKVAYKMAAEYRLIELKKVCESAVKLAPNSNEKWNLLNDLTEVALEYKTPPKSAQTAFSNALSAGVAGDWAMALWEMFIYLGNDPRPDWWERISQGIRNVYLGLEPETITPYTLFARLYYTLRAEVTRRGDETLRANTVRKSKNKQALEIFNWQSSEELITNIREEIINKWKEIEPSPPNSGIDYSAAESLIESIEKILPGWGEKLENSLTQSRAQVDLVLNAWEQKDFELARRGLRLILLWDPDRTRLITTEKAIREAPQWLARVHRGAGKDEPFYDYLTSIELAGRTIRNQVGPSKWLDETLEALKRLRKGTRSVDIAIEYPEIMTELPWLNEHQAREILSLPHSRALTPERDNVRYSPTNLPQGVVEGRFGSNQNMTLAKPLDTWAPEARGSSARVFSGRLVKRAKSGQTYAFKIMRPDQLDYSLPLFIEEIQILTMLRDVPGITPMVELGYIKIDDGLAIPSDESHASAEGLSGQVIHYGVEQAQNFLASMDRQLSGGWLPYLALVRRNQEHNLLRFCDSSYTHGWFLPLRENLVLSIQLCDILQFAHDRNIIYRDHKILHYYWDPDSHGVMVIDWNIAKRQPQGLSEGEKQFDIAQFGARALHHIFTGRPAQGSLPLGPNRPEDIESASTQYPVTWTYDDERLPNQLRTILEQTLNRGYTQVRDIRQDLLGIFEQLPGTANHL